MCTVCAPPWAICGIVNSRWFTIRIIDRFWIAALMYDACKCISSFFSLSFCNYSLSLHIISVVQWQCDHVLSHWAFTCILSANCTFPNRIGCQNEKKTHHFNFLNNMDGCCNCRCVCTGHVHQYSFASMICHQKCMFISCDSFDECDLRPFCKPLQLMSSSPPPNKKRSLQTRENKSRPSKQRI